MKLRGMFWCIAVALLAPLVAAQSAGQEELPSAPSATAEQNRAKQKDNKKAPPAQAAPQSQSAQTNPQATPGEPQSDNRIAESPQSENTPPASSQQSQIQPGADPKTATTGDTETAAQPRNAESRNDTNRNTDSNQEAVDDSLPTLRKRVDEVNVVFTVTDKHGRYVKDLKKDDFRVLDDSKPAEQIRSFHNETDLPLQVGLLVDASNSVRDRFKFEQESAIEFLNQIIRPRYDKAMVVGFDVTPEVTQDFTDNTESLSRGVRALRPGGGTALFDALYFACRDKLMKAPQKGPTRRAIILLSDGDDNQSHVTREEAIEMAQRAEVIVYTISTNISGMKKSGDKILERIAAATGGRAFFPFQIRDVSDDFAVIQDELRSQYALSYKPADFIFDGRYRTIEILAQNHKNLHVRARRGYYAPAQ
jgi:Ca-activated chloride channel family protein